MSKRDTTIMVSEEEKRRLDDIAADAFGTSEVPYGVSVSMLIKEYQQSNDSNTEDA